MSNHIAVEYTSPTSTQTFSSPLSATPTSQSSVQEKSQYLADLRANVSQMQDDINSFLTKKMDEDKAAQEGQSSAKDEEREEQMYGEENVDED